MTPKLFMEWFEVYAAYTWSTVGLVFVAIILIKFFKDKS